MGDIKPIETRYDGHRFRSRLEARWAVFFNSLGVRYQYELEGYALPSGACYLPDFFIPEWQAFIEVKPDESSFFNSPDANKVAEFAKHTGRMFFLLLGTPGDCACCWVTRKSGDETRLTSIECELSYGPDGPCLVFASSFQWKLQQAIADARGARFEFGEQG